MHQFRKLFPRRRRKFSCTISRKSKKIHRQWPEKCLAWGKTNTKVKWHWLKVIIGCNRTWKRIECDEELRPHYTSAANSNSFARISSVTLARDQSWNVKCFTTKCEKWRMATSPQFLLQRVGKFELPCVGSFSSIDVSLQRNVQEVVREFLITRRSLEGHFPMN